MANEYERAVKLSEQGRCIKCRRQKDEMITCYNCLEFKYCSIKCLEDDLADHKIYCTIIGLRKGILYIATNEEKEMTEKIKEKAKFLNRDGTLKISEMDFNKGQEKNGLDSHEGEDASWRHKTKKNKKMGDKGSHAGLNKNENRLKDEHRDNKDRSVESLLRGGRFGRVTRVDSREESGMSFGTGWWKGQFETKTKQPENSAATGAGARPKNTNRMFKDFYSDSEDDDEADKKNDSKDTKHGGKGQISSSGFKLASGKLSEPAESGMELVKYDAKKAEEEMKRNPDKRGRTVPGKCFYCNKEGSVLKCSWCKEATYCNKSCQVAHYGQHKDICKLKGRFDRAIEKVPQILLAAVRLMFGVLQISPYLHDICDFVDPFSSLLFGMRNRAIMVEIIMEHPLPFLHGVIVRDMIGSVTQVIFSCETDIYTHTMSNPFCPIMPVHLSGCLRPGNFILLMRPLLRMFPNGKRGIFVDDLDYVHFVFMDK